MGNFEFNKGEKVKDSKIPVLVTTEHRGVFFGYIEPGDVLKDPLKIYKKQMCTYYSADMHGVFGLAKYGPSKSCKIGPPVEWATVKGITSVVGVSKDAEKRWLDEPWA